MIETWRESVSLLVCDRSIFDPDDLLERMMGDRVLAKSIAETFLSDIRDRIDMLKDRLNENDTHGAELLAHSMNGAASNMAAMKFQKVASRIEKASRINDIDSAISLLTELENRFMEAEKEIRRAIL